MRIALVAPPWFAVPPAGYGGIELIVALLADGLTDLGHDVTLFAGAGSQSKASVVSSSDDLPDPALLGNAVLDTFHAAATYLDIANLDVDGRFDVVHDHSGIVGPALGAMLRGRPPVVHTLHGPWTGPTRKLYGLLADHVHLVAISEAQRAANFDIRYAGVVYNGIDLAAYPFVAQKDDFLVYIGRATPDKGPALAIEIARRAGLPLAMVVKRNEPFEIAYWDTVVAPMLNDEVQVFEAITHEAKADLLGRARAMVFPIQWPEPFGLVMVEAMACGTPVVACPVGAAPELVEEGVTGFLRTALDELCDVVGLVDQCSPTACRARVEERFSSTAMVASYERLLLEVANA
jgi:glycosyltransferase involved in cell wall biosynthesis